MLALSQKQWISSESPAVIFVSFWNACALILQHHTSTIRCHDCPKEAVLPERRIIIERLSPLRLINYFRLRLLFTSFPRTVHSKAADHVHSSKWTARGHHCNTTAIHFTWCRRAVPISMHGQCVNMWCLRLWSSTRAVSSHSSTHLLIFFCASSGFKEFVVCEETDKLCQLVWRKAVILQL